MHFIDDYTTNDHGPCSRCGQEVTEHGLCASRPPSDVPNSSEELESWFLSDLIGMDALTEGSNA